MGPMGPTGPAGTGAAGGGNFLVSPGTGATGMISPYTAMLNNMIFTVTGTTTYTNVDGTTGVTGARGLDITVISGPSGPVIKFDYSALLREINNLQTAMSMGSVQPDGTINEVYTGKVWTDGKKIYRAAAQLNITTGANSNYDWTIPIINGTGNIDKLITASGSYNTGVANEFYELGATNSGNNIALVVVRNNTMIYNSKTVNARNQAPNYVWVEYTRLDK
jgi:hypothetical protein